MSEPSSLVDRRIERVTQRTERLRLQVQELSTKRTQSAEELLSRLDPVFQTMVELAEDARAIVREIAAQATNNDQDAQLTVEAALVEARTTAEEMRLAARSYQRKSWIAVLLAAVLSSTVTLWLTGTLSPERVLSWFR